MVVERSGQSEYGSDLIVDLLVEAGIEYVAFNPGATFRGIHDSLVNHPGGGLPIVLCTHETVSVAVAQGYAKAAGRPMAVLLHDVVGLQNASMAIYNAWCDRVPMLLIGGTGPVSKARRRPWIDWIHTANAQAEVVRDYVKWDDQPADIASVPESFARALRTTTSAPAGPVYLCYDVELQEDPLPVALQRTALDAYATPSPPAPSAGDLDWLAGLLRDAEHPVILTGYAGETPEGFHGLVELAELAAVPVVDTGSRFNFPTAHELNVTGIDGEVEAADLVVILDVDDPQGALTAMVGTAGDPVTTVVNVTPAHLRLRGWSHDYQAFAPVARHITSTAGTAIEGLLARLRHEPPPAPTLERRRARLEGRVEAERRRLRTRAGQAGAPGVVARERLLIELGDVLSGERFVLANGTNDRLEHRLWDMALPGQYLGWHAGGGLGYALGASIGASLALGPDVVCVDVQADGELLYTPSALWTMAHLSLPILVVVDNNRQYGNTVHHAEAVATARQRSVERSDVGTTLVDPPVDIAALASALGVWSVGPVAEAEALRPALVEAMEVVQAGAPALVEVLTST